MLSWSHEHVKPSLSYLKTQGRGAWVVQSIKHPTLDFGSGHDLTISEIEPCTGLCKDSMERGIVEWNPGPTYSLARARHLIPPLSNGKRVIYHLGFHLWLHDLLSRAQYYI